MFQIMHNFWVEMFPMFQNYEFLYIILDFLTFIIFFRFLGDVGSFWRLHK